MRLSRILMAVGLSQPTLAFNQKFLLKRSSSLRLYGASPEGDPEKSYEGFFSFLKQSNERTSTSSSASSPPAKKFKLSPIEERKSPSISLANKETSVEDLSSASEPSTPGRSTQTVKLLLFLGACGVAAVPGVLPPGAGNYVASVVALASVVAFHEAGHLVAALSQGIKVDGYSVGFGPALFTTRGPGGVNYSLRLIPLGGFVAFPPFYKNPETEAQFKRRVEASTFIPPPPLEVFDDPDLLQNRPLPQRALVVAAGVLANFALAWACYALPLATRGVPERTFAPGVVVTSVSDAGPGYRAGLRAGDVLTDIEGWGLIGRDSAAVSATVQTIRERPGQATKVRVVHAAAAGGGATGATASAVGAPSPLPSSPSGIAAAAPARSSEGVLTFVPEASTSFNGGGTIGVRLQANLQGVTFAKPSGGVSQVATLATQQLLDSSRDVTTALSQAGGAVAKKAAATLHLPGAQSNLLPGDASKSSSGERGSAGTVSGPLKVVQMGADVAARGDPYALLAFAAAISVQLGILNALPLPALDGGQMAFIILEALRRGKKLDIRKQEEILAVSALILIAISLTATAGDVKAATSPLALFQ